MKDNQCVYIVVYDENIEWVFDEETMRNRYRDFIKTPPIYSNKDYWEKLTDVYKCNLNTAERVFVEPSDVGGK